MRKADALLAAAVASYPEGDSHTHRGCYRFYRVFTKRELESMRDDYSMRIHARKDGCIRVTVTRKKPIGMAP